MGDKSNIEWTNATWNPITGCTRVSPGCMRCYAERFAHRFSGPGQRYEGLTVLANGHPAWTGKIQFNEDALLLPLKWKKPRMIFVNSMSDLFHENVTDEQIDLIFAVMALTQWHVYQVLTKRPERMRDYMRQVVAEKDMQRWQNAAADLPIEYPNGNTADCVIANSAWPLPNVWLGTSTENQDVLNKRAWALLKTPAAVRFLSCEPLLGPLDLNAGELLCKEWRRGYTIGTYLDWVIVGGESGPGARPMHPDWARSLRDQCQADGVPFFFKQWGEWVPRGPKSLGYPCVEGVPRKRITDAGQNGQDLSSEGDNDVWIQRVGKKAAGALLDGKQWHQFPETKVSL